LIFNIRNAENLDYVIDLLKQAYDYVKRGVKPAKLEDKPERLQKTYAPSHAEVVNIICEIGRILNFYVRREEQTPDGVYRCDVTWRDYEGHLSPLKVFEVELSGNVDHALSSLTHAYDTWRPEQLFLIVQDQKNSERAKRLIEPRVKGTFARISHRLRIIGWDDICAIYESLKQKRNLIKDLAKR